MTASESAAWRWLLAHERYTPDTLRFQRRASPDFLGADGRGWEIKVARNRCVVFAATQLGPLTQHPDCYVLIWSAGGAAPEAVMPMPEAQIPGYWKQYRLAVVDFGRPGEVLNIRAMPVAGATAIKAAARARGLTLPQYLYRLALLHEAVRELAERDTEAAQILETLGLQTVRA